FVSRSQPPRQAIRVYSQINYEKFSESCFNIARSRIAAFFEAFCVSGPLHLSTALQVMFSRVFCIFVAAISSAGLLRASPIDASPTVTHGSVHFSGLETPNAIITQ